MKSSNIVWTDETLDAFLADPASVVPGNAMASFARNLEDEEQRRDLIDFLKRPDNSLDLCF
jgi:cytochrome c